MNKNRSGIALEDLHHVLFRNLCLTFHDYLVTLDRYYFTGILVNEVLVPALQHACGETLAKHLLQIALVHLYLFGKFENLKDVLVSFETYST